MVLVKWVAPVMDLLWWCNQFQRLDFRIETIHHSPCQGKVYLHTAVTHCSFWIPRADEDLWRIQQGSIGGKHFLLFFHCCWGQSLEFWQLEQLQSILVPLRDSPIQQLKYPIYLFCHDSVQALLYEFCNISVLFQDQQNLLSGRDRLQG